MTGETDESIFPSRWSALARWWTVQSVCVCAATLIVAWQMESVSGANGFALGFRHWDRLGKLLLSYEYYITAVGISAALILVQVFLIMPIRKPRPVSSRGMPLMISLAVAGIAIASLLLGAGAGIVAVAKLAIPSVKSFALPGWGFAVILCGMWAASTILLVRWTRQKMHEDALSKIANRIFQGTIIEAAAVMPVEIMVRRRTDCYCSEETLLTLVICGTVGTFACGPAIWLPVLAKRRRPWYRGHCAVCGYEMSDLAAQRCPECGTGWKRSKNEVKEDLQPAAKSVDQ